MAAPLFKLSTVIGFHGKADSGRQESGVAKAQLAYPSFRYLGVFSIPTSGGCQGVSARLGIYKLVSNPAVDISLISSFI
jgi:hypothetical protein